MTTAGQRPGQVGAPVVPVAVAGCVGPVAAMRTVPGAGEPMLVSLLRGQLAGPVQNPPTGDGYRRASRSGVAEPAGAGVSCAGGAGWSPRVGSTVAGLEWCGLRVLVLGVEEGGAAAVWLAWQVGPGGSVVAVDPSPEVSAMAWWRHRIGPTGRLTFQTGPLVWGWGPGAPYDLVLHCGPAVGRVPHAWLRQCKAPTARVLSAVRLADPAGAVGLLCVGVDEEQQPVRGQVVLDGDAMAGAPVRRDVRLHGDPHGYEIHLPPGRRA